MLPNAIKIPVGAVLVSAFAGFGRSVAGIVNWCFYGVEVVGVFGLAQNMINMPMDLIGQSVAQVYYAEISKYGKNNPEKIYNLSVSIIKNFSGLD